MLIKIKEYLQYYHLKVEDNESNVNMCDMTSLFPEILRSLIEKADILERKSNSLHSVMLSIYLCCKNSVEQYLQS